MEGSKGLLFALRNGLTTFVPCLVMLMFVARAVSTVIGVDFGSQYVKISAVVPGGKDPLSLVLNDLSERKTLNMVTFRDGENYIGSHAQKHQLSRTENTYSWLNLIAGKSLTSEELAEYSKYSYSHLIRDQTTGKANVPLGDDVAPVEYVMGLLLRKLVRWTEEEMRRGVREVVLTVPPYFQQSQRQSILDASKIAGIEVSSLITDLAAAALYYGAFSVEPKAGPHSLIFFDSGASHTAAGLVFIDPTHKEGGQTFTLVEVKHVAWDLELHGLTIDRAIASELAMRFGKKIQKPSAFVRLLQEATKIKHVLSANTKMRVFIEDLVGDDSLSTEFTREDLETACSSLKGRSSQLVEKLINASGLNNENISSIILLGGSTYLPLIKNELESTFVDKVQSVLNKEETFAKGAALYAAMQSRLLVKPMMLREAYPYPISVSYGESPPSTVTVFPKFSFVDSRKSISFKENEALNVVIQSEGQGDLFNVKLPNLSEILQKYQNVTVVSAKSKFWVGLTASGMVDVKDKPATIIKYQDPSIAQEPAPNTNESLEKTDTIPLESFIEPLFHPLDTEVIKKWKNRILVGEEKERQMIELSDIKNRLESQIYRLKTLVDSDLFLTWTSDFERDNLQKHMESSTLLLEDSEQYHDKEVYSKALAALLEFDNAANRRLNEHKCRPEAMKKLESTLTRAIEFANNHKDGANNAIDGETSALLLKLHLKIQELQDLHRDASVKLENIKNHDDPPITCSVLLSKSMELQSTLLEIIKNISLSSVVSKTEPTPPQPTRAESVGPEGLEAEGGTERMEL